MIVLPTDPLNAHIAAISRERNYFMSQRIAIIGRLAALIRGRLGWRRELPDAERNAIGKRALNLIDYGRKLLAYEANDEARAEAEREKQKPPRRLKALPEEDPRFAECERYIRKTLIGAAVIEMEENLLTVRLEALAGELPVAAWWKENVFESTRMLGCIVGEAPKLPHYTEAQLLKRMGAAVMPVIKDGVEASRVRQGNPGKDATKQDWIDHGYRDTRRAVLAVLGNTLMQGNPHYNAIYDKRKKYLQDRATSRGLKIISAEKKKKIPEDCVTRQHIHADAQRYMEKRLLRDLRRAWRRANLEMAERPSGSVP